MKGKLYEKTVIAFIIFFIIIINYKVFAVSKMDGFKKPEFSEEYLEWEKLDDEIKENSIMPRMYNVIKADYKIYNPFKMARIVGGSTDSKFDLNTLIKENLVIKNQKNLPACWTFSTLAALETNLALRNYNNGVATKYYDFSERHMEYATSRIFKNNVVNDIGFGRKVGGLGSYEIANAYLTNGTGAIAEADMPYTDSDELIDINEIKGKKVISQIYDTMVFPSKKETDIETLKQMMKEHIKEHSGIYAGIHEGTTCINTKTGALYCEDASKHVANHAILIVGWDDEYSVENFQEGHRPQNKGAWVVKDSHGNNEDQLIGTDEEFANLVFEIDKNYFISQGITSASQIPNEIIEEYKKINNCTEKNGKVYKYHNDDGYMYISYEDVNVYNGMWGIIKADDKVIYDNIYQYDNYGNVASISYTSNKVYIGNVFNKKTSNKEYLTQVAITTAETTTCKVYVNPNGTSKNKNDLQLVELKAGTSETFDAGYHTLEFLKPSEITGDNFVIVVEMQGMRDNSIYIPLEFNYPEYYKRLTGNDCQNEYYKYVSVEKNKCFFATQNGMESNDWIDLSQLSSIDSSIPDGDSTVKAFTTTELLDGSLKNIEITTAPNKKSYFEGDNFDKTGMVVKATYNRKENPIVELNSSDYSITNGTNLKAGQTSVKITYQDKSIEQAITVQKNEVVSLKIKTPPTKTEYKEGQNFNKEGMVIEATYKNGTTKIVDNYTIENGENLKADQTQVIIKYEDKTVTQTINVTANPLMEIKITKVPEKTQYVVGQNFDAKGMVVTGVFQDEDTQEILNYTIKGGQNLKKDQTYITVEYQGKTTQQEISVEEKALTQITISKKPTKLQYIQNKEELDLTGGILELKYNDNSTEEIELTNNQIKATGFDNKTIGKNTITINYQNKTTTFEVEIIKEEVKNEDELKNSNFDKAKCTVNNIKYYTFSNADTKEYFILEMTIDGIEKNKDNDSCEYYYYISTNPSEKNIENWIKIEGQQNADGKLEIKVNTNDIKNFAEILDSDKVYIYIKEVANKGGNQAVAISKALELNNNVTTEIYKDNVKIEKVQASNQENLNNQDNSIAPNSIPKAGIRSLIIGLMIITGVGIVFFIRYKKISDI